MITTSFRRVAMISTIVVLCSYSTIAQQASEVKQEQTALASWLALDAPLGWEHLATDVLLKACNSIGKVRGLASLKLIGH